MAKRKKKPNPAAALMNGKPTRRGPVTTAGALNIFQNRQSGGMGNASPSITGGQGLPDVASPMPVTARSQGAGQNQELFDFFRKNPNATSPPASLPMAPASFTPTPATVKAPTSFESPAPQPTGGPNLRGGAPQDIFSETKGPMGPAMAAAGIPITPTMRANPTLLGGRVDPNAPPATYQAQLDKIFGDAGMKAPTATKAQEDRFQKRKKAKEARRQELTGGKTGTVTVGGRRGGEITIRGDQTGTREGIQLATEARNRFGEATGSQQITVDGKTVSIPAHLDPQGVIDNFEGVRNATVGNMRRFTTQEVLAMAVDTETQISGDIETPTIRKDGREVPIESFLTRGEQARAALKAERTGLPVMVNRRSGADPRLLGRQMIPSPEAGNARRKADTAARKKIATDAIRMASGAKDHGTVKANAKAVGKYLSKSTNRTLYNSFVTFADREWDGETESVTTVTGDAKVTRKGVVEGSSLGGASFKDGKLVPGELTADNLDKLWESMRKRSRANALPKGVLAGAFEAFVAGRQFDDQIVNEFYRRHKDNFAVQLSAPIRVGAPPAEGTAEGFTRDNPLDIPTKAAGGVSDADIQSIRAEFESGTMSPRADAIWAKMTEEQKEAFIDSLQGAR